MSWHRIVWSGSYIFFFSNHFVAVMIEDKVRMIDRDNVNVFDCVADLARSPSRYRTDTYVLGSVFSFSIPATPRTHLRLHSLCEVS
jgi:hypothetical protein